MGMLLALGYEILEKYNAFLAFMVPYVSFNFILDGEKLIEMTIKIFPPDFNFKAGGSDIFGKQTILPMSSTKGENLNKENNNINLQNWGMPNFLYSGNFTSVSCDWILYSI